MLNVLLCVGIPTHGSPSSIRGMIGTLMVHGGFAGLAGSFSSIAIERCHCGSP